MKEKGNKAVKLLIFIAILIIVLFIIGLSIISKEDFRATKKAVVVKVFENSLGVVALNGEIMYYVSFAEEGNIGFKPNQEVLIYFDGMVAESYPAQIHNVGKIKIIKEKSDVEISEEVLRYFYSSKDNVSVSINKLTNTEISYTLKDTNEIPYEYQKGFKINKKNKQAENVPTIDENRIIPGTNNTTSAYLGPQEPVVLWKEVPRISQVNSETIGVYEKIDKDTTKITYNWESLYGKLEQGEYEFVVYNTQWLSLSVRIGFTIDEKGEVAYSEIIEW